MKAHRLCSISEVSNALVLQHTKYTVEDLLPKANSLNICNIFNLKTLTHVVLMFFPNFNLELYGQNNTESFSWQNSLRGSGRSALNIRSNRLVFSQHDGSKCLKALILISQPRSRRQFSLSYKFIIM